MAEMEKMDGRSMDIVEDSIEQLKALFPDVFSEGKIDFDRLRVILGDHVETEEENYSFNWHGKQKAIRMAQAPTMATLRPAQEESVDWATTQNLFIEGDNLEALKLLQKSYHRKVKMIYIDPPYNTGNEFIYPDDYKDNLETYLAYTGQVDDEGYKFSANSDAGGRYHTNWLNMVYPRLKLARNLLRDDGVIFISIDDHEQANLKKLCDEIFGELNFVGQLKWQRKKQPSFLADHLINVMEYILVYAKNEKNLGKLSVEKISGDTKPLFNESNNISERVFPAGIKVNADFSVIKEGKYTIKTTEVEFLNDVKVENNRTQNAFKMKARFRDTQKNIDDHSSLDLIFISKNKAMRRHLTEEEKEKEKAILDMVTEWGVNNDGYDELQELFGEKIFHNPKPSLLIKNLILSATQKDDIILDFFAGSNTMADAVMQLNKEDGGCRKFICIQLPEALDKNDKKQKAGHDFCVVNEVPPTIAEISKERLRRAGDKIRRQHANQNLDLGFKVFKLDSSNLRKWDADFDTLERDLIAAVDHIKQDRSHEDLLYEALLKDGLGLDLHVEAHTIANKTVYSIGRGALMACFDKNISLDVARGIIDLRDKLKPEIIRVIFRDDCFKDDNIKANALLTLKQANIDDVKSI